MNDRSTTVVFASVAPEDFVAACDLAVRAWLDGIGFGPDGKPFPRPGPRPSKALVAELRANLPAILAALREAPAFVPLVTDDEIEAAIVRGMQQYRRRDPRVRATARLLVFEAKQRGWVELISAFRGLPAREAEIPAAAFPDPNESPAARGPACPWCGLRSGWDRPGLSFRRCRTCGECVDEGEQAPRPPPAVRSKPAGSNRPASVAVKSTLPDLDLETRESFPCRPHGVPLRSAIPFLPQVPQRCP